MGGEPMNRAQRRERARARIRAGKARVKELTAGSVAIHNPPLTVDVDLETNLMHVVELDRRVVDDPLSMVWCTTYHDQDEELGYNLLDTEPSATMLLGTALAYTVSSTWTKLEPVNAWVKWRSVDSAILVSHSEGALVYALYPLQWTSRPGEIDPKYLLGVLKQQLGPDHRCPQDTPVVTTMVGTGDAPGIRFNTGITMKVYDGDWNVVQGAGGPRSVQRGGKDPE